MRWPLAIVFANGQPTLAASLGGVRAPDVAQRTGSCGLFHMAASPARADARKVAHGNRRPKKAHTHNHDGRVDRSGKARYSDAPIQRAVGVLVVPVGEASASDRQRSGVFEVVPRKAAYRPPDASAAERRSASDDDALSSSRRTEWAFFCCHFLGLHARPTRVHHEEDYRNDPVNPKDAGKDL
jgi:hypothetical protein